jgi:hypothetical protein
MKTISKLLLLSLIISCTIGRLGVYFDEMGAKPTLTLDNNILTVKTSNSNKNSALLIYQVNVSVNQSKKEIYLSADQAAGKEYRETFTLNLKDYDVNDPTNFTFYWLDPDQKKTKLDFTTDK